MDRVNFVAENEMDSVEAMYLDYLEDSGRTTEAQEARVRVVSAMVEDRLAAGALTNEVLANYEEAARCAGFYAGFAACVALFQNG